MKGKGEKETARETLVGSCLSIALHPIMTDDSEQALDPFPNRCGFNYRCDFGGNYQMFNLLS